MGANAQTSVPAFVTGQVLTAQQQTEINTGIPVFADSSARDAAFGGTGEKVLAEGQYAYLEDTNATQFYDGSTWRPVGVSPGLVFISATTIGSAVSSVTVSGAFSSTYDSYRILLTGGQGSNVGQALELQLGATVTGYYAAYSGVTYSTGAAFLATDNNATGWKRVGGTLTSGLSSDITLHGPNLAKNTYFTGGIIITTSARTAQGYLANTTQYTDFTIIAGVGTLTGGEIRVYGYANS